MKCGTIPHFAQQPPSAGGRSEPRSVINSRSRAARFRPRGAARRGARPARAARPAATRARLSTVTVGNLAPVGPSGSATR
jgi:hypothetical protein